jgi:hypothetical protein
MTANVIAADVLLAIEPPRKPWLDDLATTYDFSLLPNPRTDERLLLGVADDPAHQDQPTVFYEPDKDGNMAIYGTGGSGKSAALRGIAIAAAVTPAGRAGPRLRHRLRLLRAQNARRIAARGRDHQRRRRGTRGQAAALAQ